jgi:amino acid transporter
MVTSLIIMNVVFNARQAFHDTRFWTYETPLGFATPNMTVRTNELGDPSVVLTGALGGFAAFWTSVIVTVFSLVGWEVVVLTTPENRELRTKDSVRLSTRKIGLRITLLYVFSVFAVGLNVPFNDALLTDFSLRRLIGGPGSVFIIAAIRERVPFLPSFLNGFYVFSAFATGMTALYCASRILHAIASIPSAWPELRIASALRVRLEKTRGGVPVGAVIASWLVGSLAFLSTKAAAATVRSMIQLAIQAQDLALTSSPWILSLDPGADYFGLHSLLSRGLRSKLPSVHSVL